MRKNSAAIIKPGFVINACLSVIMLAQISSVAAEDAWSGYDVTSLNITGDDLGDADADGVIDARDDCENINSDAVISNEGCAKDKDVIARTVLDIEFKSDGWHVDKKYYPELKRFSAFYQQHPAGYVSIEGYTDSTGKTDYNMKLSQFRAQAVVKLLVDNYSFDKHKISWVGYGETKPIADNKSKAGRKKNRRILALIRTHELQEVRNWSVH